jgi:phage regulator Rha-like protein
MCNNLVYLTTNDINKATPITDSKIIASTFEKRHGDVLRATENIITKDES